MEAGGASRAALKRKKKNKKNKKNQATAPIVGGGGAPAAKRHRAAAAAPSAAAPSAAAHECAFLEVVDASDADLDPGALAAAVGRGGLEDSDSRGRRALRALLAPVGARAFYADVFEKKALHVARRPAAYLDGWCSSDDVFAFCDAKETLAGRDVDVTKYDAAAEKRRDLVGAGAAVTAKAARALFAAEAATVRLRAPQERMPLLRALCRRLEDEFGATVGANAYLTAGGAAQGFAAHWDDVDVFILQVEGSKKWTVRAPPTEALALPRASSPDFDAADLKAMYPGAPAEVVLRPGDVLYLPRGFVHSAVSGEDASLHVTLSTHRGNAWVDLLERLLPRALAAAGETEVALRASLPRDYAHFLGVQHKEEEDEEDDDDDADAAASDASSASDASVAEVAAVAYDPELPRARAAQRARRSAFLAAAAEHCKTVLAHALAAVDDAADDLAAEFVAGRLPPDAADDNGDPPPSLGPLDRVHAVSRRDARLVVAEDGVALYHARSNGPTPRSRPVACLEFEADDAPALEALLATHPARPCLVRDLPHAGGDDDRVGVAEALLGEGLLAAPRQQSPDDAPSSDDDS